VSTATRAHVSTEPIYRVAEFERRAGELGQAFRTAKPFPHVVVDGLLNLTQEQAETFPTIEWDGWDELPLRYQHNKRQCNDIERIPAPFDALIDELSRPRFLRALEAVTGIDKLIPDPHLQGGGMHLSGPGGILSAHTDFHHYRAMNLYRRINVLVYLNDNWSEADGGCLSLYTGDTVVKTIVPAWGRTMIFQTDDKSIHGFPVPVGEGKWRRSIALYYYTADEADEYSGDATTQWREHGEQRGAVRRTRLGVYRGLMNLSRGISGAAYLINPNSGSNPLATIREKRRKRQAAALRSKR
jgi:Rps23 Pro-64 3,4-dihydroxylase Tpa1-like proline 4-hydroxylase